MRQSDDRIEDALQNAENDDTDLSGMTYQDGVKEALLWVQGEITDADFGY